MTGSQRVRRRRRGGFRPPHCPNPECPWHLRAPGWSYRPSGSWVRPSDQRRFRSWRCNHCGRCFSSRTFSATYWMKRRDLLHLVAAHVVEGNGLRQAARLLGISHSTVVRMCARLGRHCLLFHHELVRDHPPRGSIAVDGFESFAYSQFFPFHLNLAASSGSWFIHGFTYSPLRRKGRMTEKQKKRRAEIERDFGRPDPKALRRGMAALLEPITRRLPPYGSLRVHSDEHPAYPPALGNVRRGLALTQSLEHWVTNSKEPRTIHNPLFPVNLADLLLRHGSANHRRETIAFSKCVPGVLERAAIFLVWRNTIKRWREKGSVATAAMLEGLLARPLSWRRVLRRRLFPKHARLTPEWDDYYWRRVTSVVYGESQAAHACRYAF